MKCGVGAGTKRAQRRIENRKSSYCISHYLGTVRGERMRKEGVIVVRKAVGWREVASELGEEPIGQGGVH